MTRPRALSKNIPKMEHPHRDLSTALRFGRDDKGEGGASRERRFSRGAISYRERAGAHVKSRAQGISGVIFFPIQFKDPTDLGVGKVLVASRSLGDPDFAGTVVLLVRYDEKGVVGLILNRRTDVPLSRVLDLKAAKDRSDPVYLGGPVGPSAVMALFESSAKMEKAENIFGGVYLISDKALFEQTISARPDPGVFHVYLGYAGWTQDQLRTEVQSGAWFVFPADTATVFDSDPDSLWLQMIQKTELQLAKTEPFAETSSQ